MWYKSKFRDNDDEEAYIDLDKTGDNKWYSKTEGTNSRNI